MSIFQEICTENNELNKLELLSNFLNRVNCN